MGRSQRKKLPFFMNTARLRTAESYFKQNYNPIDLYRWSLLSGESDSSDSLNLLNAWSCSIPEDIEEGTTSKNEDEYDSCDNENILEPQLKGFGFIWSSLQKLTIAIRSVIGRDSKCQDIEAPKLTENPPEILNARQPLLLPEVISESHVLVVPVDKAENQSCRNPPAEPHPMEVVALGKHISWDELGEIDLGDS